MRAWTLLFILLLAAPALADQVVVNSQDWRDVYTGLQYAAATDQPGAFVTGDDQANALLGQLQQNQTVLLITGRQQQSPGFRALLRSNGFAVEEHRSDNAITTNEEFAARAPTQNLVVVDDAYGYNAISVATYANMRNASVAFSDTDVTSLAEQKNPEEVLLYGHIPSARYQELESLVTNQINEQDKFKDNFALAKQFLEHKDAQSLILTNGEFIEGQLITDEFPVLFTGRENVPEEVTEFIRENDFRIATLIGNSLAPNAQQIKQATDMSIFIKFAQGRNQQQVALDLFEVPSPQARLQVSQATYNPASGSLEVTYQNPGDVATYFTGTITTADGTYEDQDPVFLETGSYKTVQYSMPAPGSNVSYHVLYGTGPTSLELRRQGTLGVEQVTVEDDSELEITEAAYDPSTQQLVVSATNPGRDAVYVMVEAVNLRIGSERVRVGSEVVRILSGATEKISLPVQLTESDLSRNADVELEVFFGAREFSLIQHARVTKPIIVSQKMPAWGYAAAAAVILAILIFFLRRRR